MPSQTSAPSQVQASRAERLRRRGLHILGNRLLVVTALALLGVLATYLLAVHTRAGQNFEEAALAGARQHRGGTWYDDADRWLNRITAESFAVSLAVIALVGILRRRWLLALCGVATAGGALAFSRILKSALPDRPDLSGRAVEFHNTLSSGHATAAMGLYFAMLIVVSQRWYPVVTVLVLPGAVGSGVATIAANWHRLSDTVAADLVCLAAGSFGLALMAHFGLVRRSLDRPKRAGWRILIPILTALALATLTTGLVYLAKYNAASHDAIAHSARAARYAYWSAQALSLGIGLATSIAMLAIAYSMETIPRRAPISAFSPVRA